jgi:dTDP-4-amino-4,6-dideoxygalactose transaminase
MSNPIPFNKPFIIGKELYYVSRCVLRGQSAGDGPYTRHCEKAIADLLGARHVLLTTSSTSALHIAAMLAGIEPGDEVIMPSYCGAAAASVFHSIGARLVFVEVDPDTLNIDLDHVEASLGERTRVILPRHYFGTCCDIDRLLGMRAGRPVRIVEDCAEAFGARYRDRALGTLGDFGAFSFHESKDVTCGEGGALVIRNDEAVELAEIIREKGTNRSQFFRGQVDKYTWVAAGSSYVPSDLLAAYLAAQLEHADEIFQQKRKLHAHYTGALQALVESGHVQLQTVLDGCASNHHGFLILVDSGTTRQALLAHLASRGISAVFHFTPLHESTMGRKLGYQTGDLPVTENVSRRIVRLPFFHELNTDDVDRVVQSVYEFYSSRRGA